MKTPRSLRAATAAFMLSGCAAKAPTLSAFEYEHGIEDPQIAACVRVFGQRMNPDMDGLKACLDDVDPSRFDSASATQRESAEAMGSSLGIEFRASTSPVSVVESALSFDQEIIPGKVSDHRATLTLNEAPKQPGINIDYDGPVLTVNVDEAHSLPIAFEDSIFLDTLGVSDHDDEGRTFRFTEKHDYNIMAETVGEALVIQQWDPMGAWGKMTYTLPGRMSDLLNATALSGGEFAMIAGDYTAKFEYGIDRSYHPASYPTGIILGEWGKAPTMVEFKTPEERRNNFELNGGFVQLDQDTWLVSATQGVLMTRDHGKNWEQVTIELPGDYGTENVESYYVDLEAGRLKLILAYPDKNFVHYVWQNEAGWVYDGKKGAQSAYEVHETAPGKTWAWDLKVYPQGPHSYEIPALGLRGQGSAPRTVQTYKGATQAEYTVWHQGTAQQTKLPLFKAEFMREIERQLNEVHTTPDGQTLAYMVMDQDPERRVAHGDRLFLVHTNGAGAMENVELELPQGQGRLAGVQLLEGQALVFYLANPEADYRDQDIRMVSVDLATVFPPHVDVVDPTVAPEQQ